MGICVALFGDHRRLVLDAASTWEINGRDRLQLALNLRTTLFFSMLLGPFAGMIAFVVANYGVNTFATQMWAAGTAAATGVGYFVAQRLLHPISVIHHCLDQFDQSPRNASAALELARKSGKPIVLYLRDFHYEAKNSQNTGFVVQYNLEGLPATTIVRGMALALSDEYAVIEASNILENPPHELGVPSCSVCLFGNDDWFSEVAQLIRAADLILVNIGTGSSGLGREIGLIRELKKQTVILLSDAANSNLVADLRSGFRLVYSNAFVSYRAVSFHGEQKVDRVRVPLVSPVKVFAGESILTELTLMDLRKVVAGLLGR